MRFVATFTSLMLCVVSSAAQYDIGISGGVFSFQLNNKAKDRYRPTSFSTSQLPWSVSAWYRERGKKAVGLQVELQWMQKAFHTEFSSGGLGGGTNYSEDVVAQFVHFHIGPEVQIGQRKLFQFRTGPQIGILVGGTKSGTSESWSIISAPTSGQVTNVRLKDYQGDVRWLFSFGYQQGFGGRFRCSIDPYVSFGLTGIHANPHMALRDIGVRISGSVRVNRKPFWVSLRKGAPTK